jgi:hypothetical protein
MIKFFYLLLAVCATGSCYSQNCPIKNGVVYERTTIPGTSPKKILDESGSQVERPLKIMNTYFIYIESNPDCHVQATRIWVGKKAFRITQEEITNTPVIIQQSNPGTHPDTLVKQTSNRVLRLQPKEELQLKPDKKITKKLTTAKVVIEYISNSRKEYYTIKDIKRIAPLVLQ